MDPNPNRATFTPAGVMLGARLTLPFMPGLVVFASAFGAIAAQKGMSLGQALATSTFVFAGASQMVAIELWRESWSWSAIAAIMLVTAAVNARMILMGASIQPWLAADSPARKTLNVLLLTDASWLIGTRYHGEGGRDLGVLLGAGLCLWIFWILSTLPGFLGGALVADPRRWGLDLLMPIFFTAMLVPLWRGPRPAIPWAVAGVTALAAQALIPGYAFIVLGALAGALAGALIDERA